MKSITALLLVLLATSTIADERILSFHSDVHVLTDGIIEVTETIQVQAEGKQIRRGIYRDFPVEYRDRLGNIHKISVETLSLQRNDKIEPYKTVRNGRDIRTYFGRSDVFISSGIHTYTYRYRANRMLGFFEQHDELYWNVTGNRWAFPIDKASATITLEFDAPRNAILVEGYTGRLGSSEQQYERHMDESGAVHFSANKPLPPAHGLTVVVGWPKGWVAEPNAMDRFGWLLKDNISLLIAVIGFVLLLTYYTIVWRKHGKDPDEGPVVTRYEPPNGFSPASLRFIRQMYYDNKVMTAAILNLAVKGYLEIKKSDAKGLFKRSTHSLKKLSGGSLRQPLAAGEQELYTALFKDGDVVILEQSNHELLGEARSEHEDSLVRDYQEHYFRINGWLNVPAIAIVLVSAALALTSENGPSVMVIGTVIAMFVTTAFFAVIMKRPTLRGRKLLDQMVGFEDYLEFAEKEDLALRNPPEKTPQLFEQYLPYALALGVDQEWSEQFASILASIRQPSGESYSPGWYDGEWSSLNLAKTTKSLSSSLHSAVSASVTPPGSSSGGGGGGFSGGGGGGGGGGGW
jgi:uncharacterized membrane protein YgcG